MSYDPFEAEDVLDFDREPYDVNRIAGSLPDLDHAKRLRVGDGTLKVSSLTHMLVTQIVSELPDYKSAANFHRDALYHRIHYWMQKGVFTPPTELQVRKYERMIALSSHMAEVRGKQAFFEELQETLRERQTAQERSETLRLVQEMVSDETDPEWRQKYLDLLR